MLSGRRFPGGLRTPSQGILQGEGFQPRQCGNLRAQLTPGRPTMPISTVKSPGRDPPPWFNPAFPQLTDPELFSQLHLGTPGYTVPSWRKPLTGSKEEHLLPGRTADTGFACHTLSRKWEQGAPLRPHCLRDWPRFMGWEIPARFSCMYHVPLPSHALGPSTLLVSV